MSKTDTKVLRVCFSPLNYPEQPFQKMPVSSTTSFEEFQGVIKESAKKKQFEYTANIRIIMKIGHHLLQSEEDFRQYLNCLYQDDYEDWNHLIVQEIKPSDIDNEHRLLAVSEEQGAKNKSEKEDIKVEDNFATFISHQKNLELLSKLQFKPGTSATKEEARHLLTEYRKPKVNFFDANNEDDLNLLMLTGVIEST